MDAIRFIEAGDASDAPPNFMRIMDTLLLFVTGVRLRTELNGTVCVD
jgi:hypothetical protein